MWKLRFRWIHSAEAGRTPRQQGNRGKKSSGETRPRQTPFVPALVCFAGMQPIHCNSPLGENSVDAKLMTSIFIRYSPIVSRAPTFAVIRTQCARSRESTQATSEAIDVAVVQKLCNFQMGSLPDRHCGCEYSSALGCQAQPATTTIRRAYGDLDQAAPLERFECGGESGAVQAEER